MEVKEVLNIFFWLALDGKNIHLALLLSQVVELAKHPSPPPLWRASSVVRITRRSNEQRFCAHSFLIRCGIVGTHKISVSSTRISKSRMTICAQEGRSTWKKYYKFSCFAQSQWRKPKYPPPPPPRVRWSFFRVDTPPPCATVILIPGWSLFRDALYRCVFTVVEVPVPCSHPGRCRRLLAMLGWEVIRYRAWFKS